MRHVYIGRSLVVSALAAGIFAVACSSPSEPAEPAAINLSLTTTSLDAIGATQQVTATVVDDEGRTLSGVTPTWSTSASGVATVSTSGLITAVANGTATVTATLGTLTAPVAVTVEQLPATPEIVQGNNQTALVGTQLTTPIRVRIADRLGNVMAGRQVVFTVTSGGGTAGTPAVNSAGDGTAQTTWTLGTTTTNLQRLSATVQGSNASVTINATATPGAASNMLVAPGYVGQGQSATASGAVVFPPSVKVQDSFGNGVAGTTVTFAVQAGGGAVTGASATSDANGIATVGSWTLGAAVGGNTLRASATGLPPVDFTANSVADVCAPSAALPISVGQTVNAAISLSDCQRAAPDNRNFDHYTFTLAAPATVQIDMATTVAALDPYLYLFNATTLDSIDANDDIVLGTNVNSRISRTLSAGSYLIRATTFDPAQVGAYTLTLTSVAVGGPASITVVAGNGQIAAPGVTLPIAPSAVVRDAGGTPLPGVTVNFATVPGVGAITGATAVTNASGVATLGSWTIAAGANVVAATVPGLAGNGAVFNAKGDASTAGYDVILRFVALPTSNQLAAFNAAVTRWETIITADLPAINIVRPEGFCNSPLAINESVDDLLIVVRLEPIDGVGSVLGSAGPCLIRNPGSIPVLGSMRFDTADLANLEAGGNFGNVILHEMGHVLGIGTIWQTLGFLQNPSLPSTPGADTHFTGPQALIGFNNIGGSTWTGGTKVPVENSQGGTGTRDSHWREGVLANELMTGFLNGGANPLSQLTIRSLQDLGYTVDVAQADPLTLALSLRALRAGDDQGIELKDDIERHPILTVDRLGRVQGEPLRKQKKPRLR